MNVRPLNYIYVYLREPRKWSSLIERKFSLLLPKASWPTYTILETNMHAVVNFSQAIFANKIDDY
jgi:hypothetical protein